MEAVLSWILKSVRYHLGFTLVIAGAGLATAVVTGNSVVVVAIAIMSALVFGTLVKDPRRSQGGKRRPGGPFSVTHRWRVKGRPNLDDIWHALSREELALTCETKVAGRVVLRGGSHLWMRLIGGYFIDPKRLPVRAELTRSDVSGVDGCAVELAVRDRFGTAVRDEALEERFLLAAANISSAVERRLEATSGAVIEPQLQSGIHAPGYRQQGGNL